MHHQADRPNEAEVAICDAIVKLMKDHRVQPGRAVFLFGTIAEQLMGKLVKEGATPQEALTIYMEHFMQGVGVPFVTATRDGTIIQKPTVQ